MSGSVSTVESGALTIMVGGEAHLLERVRPVLDTLASRVIHVGDRGAGAATKLAVNGLVHGLNVALSEAVVLAERAGVDRATAYEVFASGAGGAPFVQYKREAYEHPDDVPVAFSLDLVEKDLVLITALGDRVGAPMRQAETSLDIVHRANVERLRCKRSQRRRGVPPRGGTLMAHIVKLHGDLSPRHATGVRRAEQGLRGGPGRRRASRWGADGVPRLASRRRRFASTPTCTPSKSRSTSSVGR